MLRGTFATQFYRRREITLRSTNSDECNIDENARNAEVMYIRVFLVYPAQDLCRLFTEFPPQTPTSQTPWHKMYLQT